jgi:hypothetical protein
LAFLILSQVAVAEVTATSQQGFASRNTVIASLSPPALWRRLLAMESWWDPAHTYSGDARNLLLQVRPGGCFFERLPQGFVEHLRVVYLDRAKTLRLVGALGPLQEFGVTGSLTFTLRGVPEGTEITASYAVGGASPGDFADIARAVDQVLSLQLRRLAQLPPST